jgi:hypothetical protein
MIANSMRFSDRCKRQAKLPYSVPLYAFCLTERRKAAAMIDRYQGALHKIPAQILQRTLLVVCRKEINE